MTMLKKVNRRINRILIISIPFIATFVFSGIDFGALKIVTYLLLVFIPEAFLIFHYGKDAQTDLIDVCLQHINNLTEHYAIIDSNEDLHAEIAYRPFVIPTILILKRRGVNSCHAAP